MIYYFQGLNRNFHCPRVSPGNIRQVVSLEQYLNNPQAGPHNSAEGNLGDSKIQTLTWVPLECTSSMEGCVLDPYYGGLFCRSLYHKINQSLKGKLMLNQSVHCNASQ